MTKLVFLDTETTGLDYERHSVWDIAYILRDENGKEKEKQWFLHPSLENASPDALRLTRFYDKTKYNAGLSPNSKWAARNKVARTVARDTAGAHLVGAVPSFDALFLTKFLKSEGYVPAWHYHLVDVEALAAGYLHEPPPWTSDELMARIGVEPPSDDERHTALGDARWAKRVYDRVMGTGYVG